MTDKEIVEKILENCIIYLGENESIQNKQSIYNKLVFMSLRNDSINSSIIPLSFAFYLEKGFSGITYSEKEYLYSSINKKEDFLENMIILSGKQILFLFKFFTENKNTKESLNELLKVININDQIRYKYEFIIDYDTNK